MQPQGKHITKLGRVDWDVPRRCLRCGIMVIQKFYGPYEVFWGQRGIACGDIVDPIILENRNSMISRRSGDSSDGSVQA